MKIDHVTVKRTTTTTRYAETTNYLVTDGVGVLADNYKVTDTRNGDTFWVPKSQAQELICALIDMTGGISVTVEEVTE